MLHFTSVYGFWRSRSWLISCWWDSALIFEFLLVFLLPWYLIAFFFVSRSARTTVVICSCFKNNSCLDPIGHSNITSLQKFKKPVGPLKNLRPLTLSNGQKNPVYGCIETDWAESWSLHRTLAVCLQEKQVVYWHCLVPTHATICCPEEKVGIPLHGYRSVKCFWHYLTHLCPRNSS